MAVRPWCAHQLQHDTTGIPLAIVATAMLLIVGQLPWCQTHCCCGAHDSHMGKCQMVYAIPKIQPKLSIQGQDAVMQRLQSAESSIVKRSTIATACTDPAPGLRIAHIYVHMEWNMCHKLSDISMQSAQHASAHHTWRLSSQTLANTPDNSSSSSL